MSALAWLMLTQPVSDLQVIEIPESSKNPVIVAAIRAPGTLNPREQAAWWVFSRSLIERNERYMFSDLLEFVAASNHTLEIERNDEVIMITVPCPSGSVTLGARYLEAMLRRPRITQELCLEVRAELGRRTGSDLEAVVAGRRGAFDRVDTTDVRELWIKLMRPENVVLAVTRSETPGANAGAVRREFEDWPRLRPTPRPESGADSRFQGPGTAKISAFGWSPMVPNSFSALRLTALTALGTGLSSSVHRVTRDQQGLSYLQQAFFKQGRTGWIPMLIFAGRNDLVGEQVFPALRKDIEQWDADTLRTTQGLLEANLRGEYPLSPIPAGPESQLGATSTDRLRYAAYAALVGGEETTDTIRAEVNKIKLEDLKAEALRLLDTALRL